MNLYSHFPRCAPVLTVPAAGLWGKRVMLISKVLCCDDAPSTNTMPYTSRHLLKVSSRQTISPSSYLPSYTTDFTVQGSSVRNTNTQRHPHRPSVLSSYSQHRFHIRLRSLIAPYLPLLLPQTHTTAPMSRQLVRQLVRRQPPSILPTTSVPQDWGHQPDSVAAENLFKRILKVLQACFNATKDFLRWAVQKLILYLRKPTPVSSPPGTPRPSTPQPPPPLTNFPLMRLPTDLRMHVYEQILGDVHVLEYEQFHRTVAPDFSILRASCTIYHEARMLYYDMHTFEFESVSEIHRLGPEQRQRIKNITLHFHFGLTDKALTHWQSVCAAIAAMPAVRRLDVRWRVWWAGPLEYPTAPQLRPAWDQGMAALRTMKRLRRVEGWITTQVTERSRAESANFVLQWVGLDGLQEAFWERQAVRVGAVYHEYVWFRGVFRGKMGANWCVGIRSRRGFGDGGWGLWVFGLGGACRGLESV